MDQSVDVFVIVVGATIVLLLLLVFIISMLFAYQKRQLNYQFEMKRVKEEFFNEILKAQLEIKESTLKQVSQELHDNLGQVLSLVNLNLSAIELDNGNPSKKKLESMLDLMSHAIREVRDLSRALDPDRILNEGLASSVEREVQQLGKVGVFKCDFQLNGSERRFEAAREIMIFRIVQESLHNVIKHSKASLLQVIISYGSEDMRIRVVDNGVGFDQAALFSSGAGLKNMKSRSMLIGADLQISSSADSGTAIELVAPFNSKSITHS